MQASVESRGRMFTGCLQAKHLLRCLQLLPEVSVHVIQLVSQGGLVRQLPWKLAVLLGQA